LLDADPLTDIRNTRKIDAVVMGGKLFAKAKLKRLEESSGNAQVADHNGDSIL